jgi:hypothetical protein
MAMGIVMVRSFMERMQGVSKTTGQVVFGGTFYSAGLLVW